MITQKENQHNWIMTVLFYAGSRILFIISFLMNKGGKQLINVYWNIDSLCQLAEV